MTQPSIKKIIFFILYLLFTALGFSQQQKINSLKLFLENHLELDTIRLNALNNLSYNYYAINPDKGIETATEAIELAKKLSQSSKLATSYAYKGHNYSANGQDSLALTMYDKAITIHNKINNQKAIARLIYNKGLVYFNQSDYRQANDNNSKAYKVFEKEKDSLLMAKMLNSIGINNMYLSDYPEALSNYLKATKIYESLNLTNDLQYASIISNTGLLYARLEQLELALEYQQKALSHFKRIDYQEGVANALTNIGRVYNDLDDSKKAITFYEQAYKIMKENENKRGMASALTNIGIAYITLLDYKKALPYFKRTKKVYEELKNSNNLAIVHKNLGLCYENIPSINSLNKAENNYELALEYAKKAKSLNLQFDALESIAQINSKIGNYKKAYKTKTLSVVLKDSFNSVEKKEEIARLEVKHIYDKEKTTLKADFEKKQAIANTKIKQQRFIKNTAIAGGGILIVSAFIGYILYKRKRDALEEKKVADFNTKVAETELKALRSQMNPHFIFNSLSSISDYMAKHDIDTANDYLIKFSKLTRSILENSEKKWISLEEDLELTELYIQIESLRLKNKLSYKIVIDENIDIENTLIPPLILQPFIENSIWHGISPKDTKGHILIAFKQENEILFCSVEDDGVGRKNTQSSKIENTSMGVKITKSRLDIINQLKKTKGSFEMFDKSQGLRVELKLPLELRF
ncbi:MAG TPA: hypothetical protein DDZ39_07615 [Flavobacteriaceae bacterium]|jgi:tetratricopeptide (TPR) repeat protein|nr:hypothetical protein [Flavobacteriaceae bacterium]HBS11725.1 hypothetical protein [Flavobacteriaceae bacterium]